MSDIPPKSVLAKSTISARTAIAKIWKNMIISMQRHAIYLGNKEKRGQKH